jgi:hypothetical protein
MNRRSFLEKTALGGAGLFLSSHLPQTRHLIFIVNGGARKKDYYEDKSRAPNIQRVASEGFVFEEDHCERIGSHYEDYLRVVRATDVAIGNVFNWIKRHPYFSPNTAIVIRPEFGRDDKVNHQGQLHHSEGFYYTHRVASIFWGPDFNEGVDRNTVISRLDMTPTLAKLFGGDATSAQGRVIRGLFRTTPL